MVYFLFTLTYSSSFLKYKIAFPFIYLPLRLEDTLI